MYAMDRTLCIGHHNIPYTTQGYCGYVHSTRLDTETTVRELLYRTTFAFLALHCIDEGLFVPVVASCLLSQAMDTRTSLITLSMD